MKNWPNLIPLIGLLCAGGITLSAQRFQDPPARLTGFLEVVWQDPPAGSDAPARVLFTLVGEGGARTPLGIDDAVLQQGGGLLALRNDRVIVTVDPAPGVYALRPDAPLKVTAIAPDTSRTLTVQAAKPAPMTGNKKWITLLCRYANASDYTPTAAASYREAFGDTWPYLGQYWQENSFGLMNITGSQTSEWANLPSPESVYWPGPGSGFDSTKARDDCIAAAGAGVDFQAFFGINLVFNGSIGGPAGFGGSSYLTVNGQSRSWGMTWITTGPSTNWVNMWLFAHEMGHAFGLPHSSGPYGQVYDSSFDVMSGAVGCTGGASFPVFGCAPPHTISYHKDLLGWLPADRVLTATGGSQTVALEPLSDPAAQSGTFQMIVLPIPASTRFYTVERRTRERYDLSSRGEGVIIHEVDATRGAPAQVVDADGVPPPDDAGGNWTTGETFVDPASGITVKVDSTAARVATVTFTQPLILPSPPVAKAATIVSSGGFTANWSSTLTATGYRLDLSTGTAFEVFVAGYQDLEVGDVTSRAVLGLVPGTTYYYRVRATNAAGASASSNIVTVNTFPIFTDDVLIPGVTPVKAAHISELRNAIDALRIRFGLAPYVWTDATLSVGVTVVKGIHLGQLQAALIEVSRAAGVAGPPFIFYWHNVISATDIMRLRAGILAIW